MENYTLNRDIKVLYVEAESFPGGIMDAFKELESKDPSIPKRTFYGISWMGEDGKIIYKAAVKEEFEGEAEKLGCKTFTIKKGKYLAETVENFSKNMDLSKTFQNLLSSPDLDPYSYCLEIYNPNDTVQCLVKLRD